MHAWLRDRLNRAFEFAFGPATAAKFKRAQLVFLTLLFLAGGITWLAFFRNSVPEPFFHAIDWGVERQYYEVIQEAYQTHQIPYHVSVPIQPIQPTQRFLAIPESLYPLAPQAPLLALLTLKHFVVLNVLLHYVVGFWGCMLLRRRFDFSPAVFTILFLLFNFNGQIIAHVAAGHKWNGYFYLPLFAAFISDAVTRSAPRFETAAKIAVVNLFILLQGTLHPFAMCLIFLGLIFVFSRKARWTALLAAVFTAMLAAFRLLPAAMTTRRLRPDDFIYGYRSLHDLLNSFISVTPYPQAAFPWEYDQYLSLIGLLFVLVFGVVLHCSRRPELTSVRFRGLGLPLLLLTVFSFHDYWFQLIYGCPDLFHVADRIPNTERIPPRFMVIPLVFLSIMACARLQQLQAPCMRKKWLGLGAMLGVVALAAMLGRHWRRWRIDVIESHYRSLAGYLPAPHVITLSDPDYLRVVHLSFFFSLATLVTILTIWAWRRAAGHGAPRQVAVSGQTIDSSLGR